ncbi:response regulator [Bacteriovorax sp. Seq25_V]|uniref:response regulator n=1 Tax=Bacteriovorax sp. Seq25_V TaxID=1201288 RepID=UPI00038A3A8C|nr:response regulator [Bacteriovorax sp. Seq25_V]EQC43896.1 Hpt domain protein [Bacteriovorax sp. Seq25_V]
MEEIEKELKLATMSELEDHLAELSDVLYGKEVSEFGTDDYNQMFRVIHSIKGNTRACGFDSIAEISHLFESKLIQLKNGEIEFDSKSYDTSLMYLNSLSDYLEILKVDLTADFDFYDLTNMIQNQASDKPMKKNNFKFLIIDDDPDIQEIVSTYLKESFNCEIATSANGQEGLRESQAKTYDVIICDYMMPELDGKAFINQLRKSVGGNQHTPIIFLSGYRPEINADEQVWEKVFFAEKPLSENKLIYYIKCSIELGKIAA